VFARSTTVQVRPRSLDAAVARVRDDVMPAVPATEGCLGVSMLVNPTSGRCIVTSAWLTEEAMIADQRLQPLVDRATTGSAIPEVEDWEIGVVHRDHTSGPGAWVRVSWVHVEPEQVDRLAELYRMVLLPTIVEFGGFCSASLLLDRPSGHAVSSVTFDSYQAMRTTRTLAAGVREHVDGEVLEVDELQLALAHLRVSEPA
jgi:quinol monooxygenase YgiN